MKAVLLRTDEEEALRTLDEYDILNSLPEKEYDDLVYLASLICDTPHAFVNFIGKDFQWTKANFPKSAPQAIARRESVCTYTVLSPKPLIINNLSQDERTKDLPAVVGDDKLLFYAGVPLTSPSGHQVGAICVVDKYPRDLSEEKLNALVALSRQLISLLELRKKKKEIENLSENKSKFLALVSHEVRNPLNALTGYLQMLDRSLTLNAHDRKDITECLFLVENINQMVSEILDFSKISNGKLQFNPLPIELSDLFYKIDSNFKAQAERKGLTYESHIAVEDVVVKIDQFRITQICQNIFSNALKFTTKGKLIFRVDLLRSSAQSYLQIKIADTGKGIEEKRIESIFLPFEQENQSIELNYGGTGLGLSIVKSIVDALQGEIMVESQVGYGSSFTIKIPIDMLEHSLKESRTLERKTEIIKSQKILLVEDNESNIIVMNKILNSFGLKLDVARCGDEALVKSLANKYDLIFLDYQLPDMLGTEIARVLRKEKINSTLVAFSANVFEEDIENYFQAGFQDVLSKPAKVETVLATILKWQRS